jgi:hypothetical protein
MSARVWWTHGFGCKALGCSGADGLRDSDVMTRSDPGLTDEWGGRGDGDASFAASAGGRVAVGLIVSESERLCRWLSTRASS